MKDKDKQNVSVQQSEEEMGKLLKDGPPFVFEQDKKLVEELARHSKYIRGLFSRAK